MSLGLNHGLISTFTLLVSSTATTLTSTSINAIVILTGFAMFVSGGINMGPEVEISNISKYNYIKNKKTNLLALNTNIEVDRVI